MSEDQGDIYTNTGDTGMDADVSGGDGLASGGFDASGTMDTYSVDLAAYDPDGSSDQYATDPAAYDAPEGNVEMSYDGVQYDAGAATLDLTGDGVADTAVQDHGYQVEYYVDSTGDGVADELTITDADGDLISQEVFDPTTGEWIDVTGQAGG